MDWTRVDWIGIGSLGANWFYAPGCPELVEQSADLRQGKLVGLSQNRLAGVGSSLF